MTLTKLHLDLLQMSLEQLSISPVLNDIANSMTALNTDIAPTDHKSMKALSRRFLQTRAFLSEEIVNLRSFLYTLGNKLENQHGVLTYEDIIKANNGVTKNENG